MVLTHKSTAKRKPVVMKPRNLTRKFMSKSEVLLENAKEKVKKQKLKEAEAKINEELGIVDGGSKKSEVDVVDSSKEKMIPSQHENQSDGERLAELEALKNSYKGPGSLAKKKAVQVEIDKLNK